VIQTEVLVLGCGIAGATTALRLARNPQRKVIVITRDPDLEESNTRYAQGGIVTRGLDDNADDLVADILVAGAGASYPKAARILAEKGPPLLEDILSKMPGLYSTETVRANWSGGRRRHTRISEFFMWVMAADRPLLAV
jgi:L-aspartate oxidase